MKFLLDQQLSTSLVNTLRHEFPGTAHAQQHGLERAKDEEIWEFAKRGGLSSCPKMKTSTP